MTTIQTCPQLLIILSKIESAKLKLNQPISFSYDLTPLNKQQFQKASQDLFQSMRQKNVAQKDFQSNNDIILGLIEGKQADQNLKQAVEQILGQIDQTAFKAYLQQKTQIKNYAANPKDKKYCIRQIKKLQLIQKYFDINQIKKKRKANNLYKVSARALKKFVDLFSKIQQQNEQSVMQVYAAYNSYFTQEKKYQTYLKSIQKMVAVIDKQFVQCQAVEQIVQIKSQQHKIIQQKQMDLKQIDDKKQIQCQKTPKKGKKKISKTTKNPKPSEELNNAQKEQKQKDKIKTVGKKKVNPIVANNKTITDFFKRPVLQLEKTVKKQQIQNQESPENMNNIQEYTFNPVNIPDKLTNQIQQPEQKQIKHASIDPNQRKRLQLNGLFIKEQSERIPLDFLKNQLKNLKMLNQNQKTYESYFTNLILTLSTIEYYNYCMKQQKQVDFANPFIKIHQVFYFQDQSQQFQGQSANDSNTFTEQIMEESDDNSSLRGIKILDDDHLSSEQISEVDSDAADIKVQYGKGAEWSVTSLDQNWPRVQNFVMIALFQNQLPLKIYEEPEPLQTISPSIWEQIYMQSHGFYGPKQNLIKNISIFAEKVSKNWIDNTLKERTQKIGVQRFIKQQFIEQLKEKIPDIQQKLNQIKFVKEKQLHEMKQEKNQQRMQQRNQKLEKDLLQCEGSKYIVDLLKYLKEKGHKQLRKKQLEQFINEREGQQWNAIKAEINTMSKPVKKVLLKQAEQMKPLFNYNIVQMMPQQNIQAQNQANIEKGDKQIVVIESDKSNQFQMKEQMKITQKIPQQKKIENNYQIKQAKQSSKQTLKSSRTSKRSVQNKENRKKRVNVSTDHQMDLQ